MESEISRSRLAKLIPLCLQGYLSSTEEKKQSPIINWIRKINTLNNYALHSVARSCCSRTVSICFSFTHTQTQVHLELLIQHVHGSGLWQQRSPAAVLFQAGEGHPVKRRVRRAWSGENEMQPQGTTNEMLGSVYKYIA